MIPGTRQGTGASMTIGRSTGMKCRVGSPGAGHDRPMGFALGTGCAWAAGAAAGSPTAAQAPAAARTVRADRAIGRVVSTFMRDLLGWACAEHVAARGPGRGG